MTKNINKAKKKRDKFLSNNRLLNQNILKYFNKI